MISFLVLMNLIGVDFGLSRIIKDLMLELPNSRKQELEGDDEVFFSQFADVSGSSRLYWFEIDVQSVF